jgi:hypothetical protein
MGDVLPFFESDLSAPDLKQQLRKSGYLFFKKLFSPEQVIKCRKQVIKTLFDLGWAIDQEQGVTAEEVHRINSPAFYKCIGSLMRIRSLHELAYEEPLHKVMAKLLNNDPYAHPRKMVRISYPIDQNPKDLIPAHQDICYVRGEVDTFTVWIPFGNYSIRDGGLMIAEGSHKRSLLPTKANDEGRFGCQLCEIPKDEFVWRQSDFEMGDCLIFHSLTLHASAPNRSNRFRVSLDCRFSAAAGFLNEEQLLPPYFPNVESWEVLTKGWSQPDLFSMPPTLKIQPAATSMQEVMKIPSEYVAAHEEVVGMV